MNSKPKKLLIIGSSQGVYGGIEAFMMTIAKAASQWPEYDVKLCFKLTKGSIANQTLKQAANNSCNSVSYVNRGSLSLTKVIGWADILHVQNTPPDIIFISKLLGKKIFLTVHNWRIYTNRIHYTLWGISIKLTHKRWFNSNFVWNTWEPKEKSKNSEAFPTVSMLPQTWCEPSKRKGFIFLGRWIENKGIEEILKAYSLNKFDVKEHPLTILGDGPLKPTIDKLINELNLEGVKLPGFVDAKVKDEMLASSKWLLAPANTKEDLGLTPIEARSVGVPSIVTNDGGLPEAGGEAALIAIPGDVEDLAKWMKIAINMKDDEYISRSKIAKESLKNYLKPIEFYRHAYMANV
ncbi:glycosyltransferase [Maribacter dokdonensis]|uniref:glycosyltransferase n=1 Tax=Maribacter dokdonensis TaxID=320912 RepID=UPI002AB194ED|nr:glycosyltransferase [Maribacter dokdonensis]